MAINYNPNWKDGLSPYEQGLKRAKKEFKRKYPSGYKPSRVYQPRECNCFSENITFLWVMWFITTLMTVFFLWVVHVLVG
jgi:hypothetical protein